MSTFTKSLLTLFSALLLIGCAGTQTFNKTAMPGDTVAVAAGYRHHFQRDNITVTITDSAGATTVYDPGEIQPESGNIGVRAVINLYPDPLSSWVVSDRTGVQQTPNALTYVDQNLFQNTESDYDWWQTVVFVDLPETMEAPAQAMATGEATIFIETPGAEGDPGYEKYTSTVNVVPGTGQAHAFGAITKAFGVTFPLEDQHMQAMERVPHLTVNFTGTTVPHAIQLELSHDTEDPEGAGTRAYVSNPVGHIKSVTWADDVNTNTTRIILMPNRDADIRNTDDNFDGLNDGFQDFKINLAGIAGWTVIDTTPSDTTGNVQAFDIDGNEVLGVTASLD